jgi:hypothetical protein
MGRSCKLSREFQVTFIAHSDDIDQVKKYKWTVICFVSQFHLDSPKTPVKAGGAFVNEYR